MKRNVKRILSVILAVLLTAGFTAQAAYAQDQKTQDAEADNTVTVVNAETVYIEASQPVNVYVRAYDNDIAVDVDTSGASKGYIEVSCDKSATAKAKILIKKDDVQYVYTVGSDTVNLPLQMGDGTYTIIVYKHIYDTKYSRMTGITMKVEGLLDRDVYTNSMQMADYEKNAAVISEINKLLANAKTDMDKAAAVYDYIIKNYRYDAAKAAKLRGAIDYIPDLGSVAMDRKGICYDFASLYAAVLRSNGIQTKLVMGYRSGLGKYHAWNEVFLDGKWKVIDTTYDVGMFQKGFAVNMISDAAFFSKMEEY